MAVDSIDGVEAQAVSTRHPFAYRDFRYFWTARICAMLAHSGLVVALGWAVYDEARLSMGVREAALRLGLIGLVQFLPMLMLSPFTGLAADRYDRRNVVRLALVGQLSCATILSLLAFGPGAGLYTLYATAALFAASRAFYMPAMNALPPALVPRATLPQAIAISAVAGRIGGILGPVLGGFAYAWGAKWAFGLCATLLLAALLLHLAIRPLRQQAPMAAARPLQQMLEGLRYVLSNRLLLGAISLDLFAVLLGGVTALLPIFARDVLHVGPDGLGQLRAASSVGALATAVWLSWRPLRHEVGVKMLACVALFGAMTVSFGLSRSMSLSLACLALMGAVDMVSVYIRQSLLQIATPDDKRGRVGAISSLFVAGSNELGEMESGLVASLIGPVGAVITGGIAAVLVAGLWAGLFPELRRARRFDQVQPG
ncbi:MFS transporter [Sphingobium sp. YR768]|uniref:MFS transporter n=1 Tax=Sphingobium sp. YR768 TaxID=1884365 RepID=UPI0008C0E6D1|nr:MFS transporter [Sphingobium sp. YR768]SER44542.1 Predicted arabinose efflux permease, MFS family [Sphingobium sp. YR768]